MPDYSTQKFTIGVVFSQDFSQVLLAHKTRPEWQAGKLNVPGGKYEPGEAAEVCVRREFLEETGLDIQAEDWRYLGAIGQDFGDVGVLTARYLGATEDVRSLTDEKIEWFPTHHLPEHVIPNLRWLIPLAEEGLTTGLKEFFIKY